MSTPASNVTLFSPQQLAQIAAQVTPMIPDGHRNAVIGTVDATGAQAVAIFKLGSGDNWEATAVGRHDWSGENEVGASLIYSW